MAMEINTEELAMVLEQSGDPNAAQMVRRNEMSALAVCRYLTNKANGNGANGTNGNGVQLYRMVTTGGLPSGTGTYWPAGSAGGGVPGTEGACRTLEQLIAVRFLSKCGFCPNECLIRWMVAAVMLTSYAETRDSFSIPELSLLPTGIIPTGLTSDMSAATTFVAGFPLQPGRSILMRLKKYALPMNPRCLWGVLAFSGGITEDNYVHVTVKVWVGPKTLPTSFSMQDGTLTEWNPETFIYGSEFRCGDSCKEVPLRGIIGCTDADIVGPLSAIYIQIDNLGTASNNVQGQQFKLRLGGFVKPCCNSCMKGNDCESGCASKH